MISALCLWCRRWASPGIDHVETCFQLGQGAGRVVNLEYAVPYFLDEGLYRRNMNPGPLKRLASIRSMVGQSGSCPLGAHAAPIVFDRLLRRACARRHDVEAIRHMCSPSAPRHVRSHDRLGLCHALALDRPPRDVFYVRQDCPHHRPSTRNGDVRRAILKESQVARCSSWIIEQVIWIVDRIPEEHFATCRDHCEGHDVWEDVVACARSMTSPDVRYSQSMKPSWPSRNVEVLPKSLSEVDTRDIVCCASDDGFEQRRV